MIGRIYSYFIGLVRRFLDPWRLTQTQRLLYRVKVKVPAESLILKATCLLEGGALWRALKQNVGTGYFVTVTANNEA